MSKKLFSTESRDDAHQHLEKILEAGEYPKAECREDHNIPEYSVWDGPAEKAHRDEPIPVQMPELNDALINAVIKRLLETLKAEQ